MTAPDPYTLAFEEADWQNTFAWLRSNPRVLFNDPGFRRAVCERRAALFNHEAEFTGDRSNMIDLTVDYNKAHQRERFLESHSSRLIWPLMAIDPVYEHAAELKVLSVGPRTCGELFKLVAAGFKAENVTMIDVVSNDPLIQIMDMHAMTFADNTFDIVISGWTLPYSRYGRKAIREHARVLKTGGLLAIGLTREPPESDERKRLVEQGSSVYPWAADIIADIERAGEVHIMFEYDPLDLSRKGAILVIARVIK